MDKLLSDKVCPIISAGADGRQARCLADKCAWWDDKRGLCAVLSLYFTLQEASEKK
jgi:hypothetical protein